MSIKVNAFMVEYVAAYLSCVYGSCRVCNFSRNIVHLLVLLNKYVKNARCNNKKKTLISFSFAHGWY